MSADHWKETQWEGEQAFELTENRWHAVVSVERGRLVHFGPANEKSINLLLTPKRKNDRFGYGGHRVWLGTQQEWPTIWPPPDAWEKSAAKEVSIESEILTLVMPPSPKGWPDIVRRYRIFEGALACSVEMVGGSRNVQVMQIIRTPVTARVQVRRSEEGVVEPYRILASADAAPASLPTVPPQAIADRASWIFGYQNRHVKLAFAPQPLEAVVGHHRLICRPHRCEGEEIEPVDGGLYTQIYLGSERTDPVIELEQLGPRMKAGQKNSHTLLLDLDPL